MSAKAKQTKKQRYDALNKVDEEWKAEDESMFGFSVQQVAIPSLTIVQPSSRMGDKNKHLGQIYNTVTREFFNAVELAFVGWNTPRAVLPFPFDATAPQLCASPNSVQPYPKYVGLTIHARRPDDDLEATVPDVCEDCQFSVGGFCTQMFRYFGIQMENGYPFTMRLKRTAMEAARTLNFWLAQNERKHEYKTFIMTTEEVVSDTGNFYKPMFTVGKDATALLGNARELNRALSDRVKRQAQKQLEAPDEEE